MISFPEHLSHTITQRGYNMAFIKNPQLDGNPFFYKGNKVGFLLIHGFTATTTEVRLLADKLHKDGYTVSAPLLPGHMTTPEDMNTVPGWIGMAPLKRNSCR